MPVPKKTTRRGGRPNSRARRRWRRWELDHNPEGVPAMPAGNALQGPPPLADPIHGHPVQRSTSPPLLAIPPVEPSLEPAPTPDDLHVLPALPELGVDLAEDDDEACPVCLTGSLATTLQPCGHQLCATCPRNSQDGQHMTLGVNLRCPLCRQEVTHLDPPELNNLRAPGNYGYSPAETADDHLDGMPALTQSPFIITTDDELEFIPLLNPGQYDPEDENTLPDLTPWPPRPAPRLFYQGQQLQPGPDRDSFSFLGHILTTRRPRINEPPEGPLPPLARQPEDPNPQWD